METRSLDLDAGYTQNDMCPDRTMSDFYCKICDAHMNSEQMWESHVSGKRHLKNVKKEPGEMPSKVKAIKLNAVPKLMDCIHHVDEPLVGLGFMTELQRADPTLNPSYTCHLCQANLTWSVVIEHIIGTKHRLAYLKVVDPEQHDIIETMELKKTSLDRLAEDRAREYERKQGCGTMEVKLEKPKIAPPPPKKEKSDEPASSVSRQSNSSRSLSSERHHDEYDHDRRSRSPIYRYKRSSSPVDGKWRHDKYCPESPPARYSQPSSSHKVPKVDSMSMSEKLHFIRKVSERLILVSETEVSEVKSIMNTLAKSAMKHIIRSMPIEKQNKLAKQIVRSDTWALERELRPSLEYVFDGIRMVNSASHRHRRSSSSNSQYSSRRRH